eukprot:CAMPEP_0184335700 /NCGR_PEP_ID=MMETSP1089-20130417/4231_1 /TAXON_ID=38269 ORGANISM="Gloeochaete wittrockiana, Strain SAG46.84" /NCGR_SAMPLE_ID=MMETSP1089 /ASSEMBLY_ACC=CAM_ASM_000445 /LENGTH=645 /DNA_ID=CAMNT_0026660507 /DNA_START=59 /DNA_END=1993 /DNA_ORIENTATION=+
MNYFGLNQDLSKFACVSADNRIKIWDTLTDGLLQQFKQSSQFNAVYTCARWGPRAKLASKSIVLSETLAMGTQVGTVVYWDITKGEIVHTLGESAPSKKASRKTEAGAALVGAVSDVWFHPTGKSLFATYKENNQVVEFDLSTGNELRRWKAYSSKSSKGVDAIRVTTDGNFAITASSNNCSIKVWDMSTLRSVSKFVGHSSSISGLTVSKDNSFLLSSAVDERFLNLWRLNELELLTKKKTAVAAAKKGAAKRGEKAQLVLDDDETASSSSSSSGGGVEDDDDEDDSGKGKQPKKSYSSKSSPTHSNISPFHTNGSSYHVLSVTGSCVSVWEYEVDGESSAKPVSELRLGRSDRQNPIIWADFFDETTIIVVRGPHFKPHFEKLAYIVDGEFVKKQKASPLNAKGLLDGGKSSTKKAKGEDEEHDDDVVIPNVYDAAAVPTATRERKRKAVVTEEKTIEETLMELNEDDEDDKDFELNDNKNKLPKSDTVITVLLQALKTGDEELLGSCVSVTDERVIHSTVRLLPTRLVLQFLTLIIEKFQLHPKEAPQLIPWIKAVLEVHTAFVMGLPNNKTSFALSGLYHTVDSRLSAFSKLLTLSGRLDLILSQVSSLERVLHNAPSEAAHAEIVLQEEDVLEEEDPADA